MKFDVFLDTSTSYGEVDPDDSWDRADTDETLHRVYATRSETGQYEVAEDVSVVYVVIQHYGDGDTFGHDTGYEVMDAFASHAEAFDLKQIIDAMNDTYSIERNGKKYYVPGSGYFGQRYETMIEPVLL